MAQRADRPPPEEGPLTRRAVLRRWPDAAVAPAQLTLWKWLGRAVQEGRVLQDGRGTRKEPFRYQLPGMVQKWQQNFQASFMKRLEQDDKGNGPERLEAPLSGADGATPAVPKVRPEEATVPLDAVPLPEQPKPIVERAAVALGFV